MNRNFIKLAPFYSIFFLLRKFNGYLFIQLIYQFNPINPRNKYTIFQFRNFRTLVEQDSFPIVGRSFEETSLRIAWRNSCSMDREGRGEGDALVCRMLIEARRYFDEIPFERRILNPLPPRSVSFSTLVARQSGV